MKPGSHPTLEIVEDEHGTWYMPYDPPDGWLNLGVCPEPRTQWQTFWYHVGHGLVMQYNLIDILVFAWRYRNWNDNIIVDALEETVIYETSTD